jgi:hypothetical protein
MPKKTYIFNHSFENQVCREKLGSLFFSLRGVSVHHLLIRSSCAGAPRTTALMSAISVRSRELKHTSLISNRLLNHRWVCQPRWRQVFDIITRISKLVVLTNLRHMGKTDSASATSHSGSGNKNNSNEFQRVSSRSPERRETPTMSFEHSGIKEIKKTHVRPPANDRTCMGWHERHAPDYVWGSRGIYVPRR